MSLSLSFSLAKQNKSERNWFVRKKKKKFYPSVMNIHTPIKFQLRGLPN